MNPTVIAIDPGPKESALVAWNGRAVIGAHYDPNIMILNRLLDFRNCAEKVPLTMRQLVIEKIASYGMPVGEEVFETVFWSGRFAQAYGVERTTRITRIEVKSHICHSARAKDSNIRQALIDRFGPVGTKKAPGPMFGMAGDLWAALAVAVTFYDRVT